MKYLLAFGMVVIGISAVGCGSKGSDKNPVIVTGDSVGTSVVAEDSAKAIPVEEIPVIPTLRLAFISGQYKKYDIFLWKTDGSAPINLTQSPGQYSSLAWSPDGNKLAFVQGTGVPEGGIYVLEVEENRKVKLVGQQGYFGDLVWSPDGTRLAFSYQRNIYVMNADGSNMEALTSGSESGYDSSPTWSPDGSRIAFSRATTLDTISFGDPIVDIFEVKADGSHLIRLTGEPFTGIIFSLAWSPDGGQIAFVQNSDATHSAGQDIYVLNVREGNSTNLTNSPGSNESDLAWSPDGSQVAFSSYGAGIFVANTTGSSTVAVSRSNDLFPKWEPDGQQIAYVHYESDLDIYLANVIEGSRINLTAQNSVPTKDILFFTGFFVWAPK